MDGFPSNFLSIFIMERRWHNLYHGDITVKQEIPVISLWTSRWQQYAKIGVSILCERNRTSDETPSQCDQSLGY